MKKPHAPGSTSPRDDDQDLPAAKAAAAPELEKAPEPERPKAAPAPEPPAASAQKPGVGRMVHYTYRVKEEIVRLAAIITEVHDEATGVISLSAHTPARFAGICPPVMAFEQIEPTTERAGTEAALGKWSWPPRI